MHTDVLYIAQTLRCIQNRFQRVVSIFKQFPAVSNYKLDLNAEAEAILIFISLNKQAV